MGSSSILFVACLGDLLYVLEFTPLLQKNQIEEREEGGIEMRKITTFGSYLKRTEGVRRLALVLTLMMLFLAAVSFYLKNVVLGFILIVVAFAVNLILDWQWNVRLSHSKREISLNTWLLGILLALAVGGLIGTLWS